MNLPHSTTNVHVSYCHVIYLDFIGRWDTLITSLSSLSLLNFRISRTSYATRHCPVCNIVGLSSSYLSSLSSGIPCITPCASKPGFLLVYIVKPLKFLPTNDSGSVANTQIRYHILCFTASFVTVCSKLFPPVV